MNNNRRGAGRHILALYVLFFAVIIISIAGKIIPDINDGVEAAKRITALYGDTRANKDTRYYFISGVSFERYMTRVECPDNCICCESGDVTAYVDRANLVVERKINPDKPDDESDLLLIGDNPIYYILSILVSLCYLAMLILIASIIRSLRRSIDDQTPIVHNNVFKVRAIGGIIIFGELLTSLMEWQMDMKASKILEGTHYHISTAFSPDYMILIMGVLVLFMGELFSIAHTISEEQKFTV